MASTVWKGHSSFGLVSIPVRLYRAARAEKVSFRRLHRTVAAQPAEPELDELSTEPTPVRLARRDEREPIDEVEPERSRMPAAQPLLAPVRNLFTSAENAQPIPREEIVKGYEVQPQQYVVVSDDELRRLTPRTSSDIQILEFVQLSEIDPVYFETSYYVARTRVPR